MIITQNGEARAAIMDIRAYEDLRDTIHMLELIAQGQKSLGKGKFRPAEDILDELEQRIEQDFS